MIGSLPALRALYDYDREQQGMLVEQRTLADQLREADVVKELDERRHALARRLKDEREQASDRAWELEEIELRIQTLLAEGDTEGDALASREVKSLRQRKAVLEDDVLLHLEQVDAVEQEQIHAEVEWLRHRNIWAERRPGLEVAAKQVAARLAALDAARATLIATLAPEIQAAYSASDRQHPGSGLALNENGHCSACEAAVPADDNRTNIRTCTTCGRMLIPAEHGSLPTETQWTRAS